MTEPRKGRWVYNQTDLGARYVAWFRDIPDPLVWALVEAPRCVYEIQLPGGVKRTVAETPDVINTCFREALIVEWVLIFDPEKRIHISSHVTPDSEARLRACLTSVDDPHSCAKCGAPNPCEYHP